MERIQRALEISRLQRATGAEALSAVVEARSPAAEGRAAADARLADARPAILHHNERPSRPDVVDAADDIAQLPALTVDRSQLSKRKVVFGDESNVAAQAYRMLRAQVLQRARATRMRSVGILSATTGEGKTLTAINLALSLAAEPNQRVTLVDLDLKRPSIARVLGISPEYGLDTWLSGTAPLHTVHYQLADFQRLRVVPTLAPVTGSSELLASARARQLFDDMVSSDAPALAVVDLPPVLLSDDVLTAAALVDSFLLVITEGQTLREDVERVFELLGRNRIMGTVLNGSSASEQRAY